MTDDGGRAFPGLHYTQFGMSLRDWFAGMALQGAMQVSADAFNNADKAAEWAYCFADAMLAARKKESE